MLHRIGERLVHVNGVPFEQGSVFGQRKDVGLYIRISQQTKTDIEYLCKANSLSQSELVSVLVAEAVRKDGV